MRKFRHTTDECGNSPTERDEDRFYAEQERRCDEEREKCKHENKTFNWDIGAFVCDDCNERI